MSLTCSRLESVVNFLYSIVHISLPPLSLPSSLSLFCSMFAVSCLGLGPLCQSLFTHQTRTPTDDPRCHSLSTAVEGGHILPSQHLVCVWHVISVFWLCLWQVYFLCSQVSMLGSRFAVLMLFTRVFKQWILGVIGKSECQEFIS